MNPRNQAARHRQADSITIGGQRLSSLPALDQRGNTALLNKRRTKSISHRGALNQTTQLTKSAAKRQSVEAAMDYANPLDHFRTTNRSFHEFMEH